LILRVSFFSFILQCIIVKCYALRIQNSFPHAKLNINSNNSKIKQFFFNNKNDKGVRIILNVIA
jgi:hypothetical protein